MRKKISLFKCGRKRKFFILLGLGLLPGWSAFSQSSSWGKLIPAGYEMIDTLSGDLNADGRMDLLMIIKVFGEDTIENSIDLKRPLLIFIRQRDGTLKLTARNDEVVLCLQCGGSFGDPYRNMVITDSSFSVEHYGGSSYRWSDEIIFKYNEKKKSWFLLSWGGEGNQINEPDKESNIWLKTTKNFGVVEFAKFKRSILQ